jgi:twinkle protein
MKIFDWNNIQHKSSQSGTAKLKCPECNDARKNKADRPLYVRYDSGIAKCFHCDALSFRDSIEKSTKENNFKLPEQNWKNYTTLSENVVKWFEGRGIQQFTLNHFDISEEKYYQPQLQKEVNNIVFNFFEGEMVVNKKYRSACKKFTQSAGTKSIFYNINSVIGKEECFIVEGEIDCISLHQEGFTSVISVPNGANDNDAYWINSEPYLKDIKKFYIGTDNDTKGNELAEKIAQRLGRYRCERINFECKDANEDLVSGVLKESIYNRTKYPVSGTFKVNDLYDKIIDLYDNGLPPTIYPKHKSFGNLKDVFTVMRGHLVTVTGIPSHGKSNFVEWYVMNLVNDYEMKASFFSPEHQPMEQHQSTFIQKFTGKNFYYQVAGTPRLDKIEIAKYAEWANEKIYLTSPEQGEMPTWDWLYEKFKEQMFNYGVDVFVIDAFNKLEFSDNRSERERINSVLKRLTSFAQQNNVIIFLVAHPTKMQKDDKTGLFKIPDLYSVSGSADFRNQTHDGFCIYRYFDNEITAGYTSFVNLKTKFSFQGEIGQSVDFNYDKPSGRYYAVGTEPNQYLLNHKKDEQFEMLQELSQFELLPKVEPNDAFDEPVFSNNDETPF